MSTRTLSCSPTTVDCPDTLTTANGPSTIDCPDTLSAVSGPSTVADVPAGPTPVTLRSAGQYDSGRCLEPCAFIDSPEWNEGGTVQVLSLDSGM